LLKALARLEVAWVLIGNGPDREDLLAQARAAGFEEQLHWIPSVPHGEIANYYQKADIFAIATHYEGFCIPIIEAMAAGIPVVASRVDPIPEILNGAGITVENTPEAFHQAIDQLLKDPDLLRDLSRRGRERARDFDSHRWDAREASVYGELIGLSVPRVPEAVAARTDQRGEDDSA
jgi:glycosyltransferase involved in cell wall biosynthesis